MFEVKYARSQEGLPKACEEALTQIDAKLYAEEFRDDYASVICYGVSFYKKRCLVQLKK